MKPKPNVQQPQRELFRVELSLLIDNEHPLVKLGGRINWAHFEEQLGATYHPKTGAPGVDTRLMVALHYLKYQHNLSDEAVVARWTENPYWQHFSGRQFFEHEVPINPSSMMRWQTPGRSRCGDESDQPLARAPRERGHHGAGQRHSRIRRMRGCTTGPASGTASILRTDIRVDGKLFGRFRGQEP